MFKNERLPDSCYNCGRLSRTKNSCPFKISASIDKVDRKYGFHAFESNGESRGEQAEKKNTGKNGRNSSGTLPEKSSEKVLSSVTQTRNNSKEHVETFWRCQNSLSSRGFPLIKHIAITNKNES